MNVIPFRDLKIILSQLSKQEISSARKFVVAFDADGHKLSNKNDILFDYLLQNPLATYSNAKQSGGKFDCKKSFDQQCRRLKEKIAESLILDVNIKKNEANRSYQNIRLYVRKKLLIASMLMERGAENEAFSICKKLIRLAKEYELYSELQEIMYWLKNEPELYDRINSTEQITQNIDYYRYCDNALYRAKELITTCSNNSNSECNPFEHLQLLACARAELAQMFIQTKSANIAYYYYLLEVKYNFAKKNYDSCCGFGLKLTKLISSNPVVMTDLRLGSAYVELARSFNHLGDYEQAALYAEMAQQFLPANTQYFDLAMEIKFKSLFNRGQLEEATMILQKLIEITDKKKQPYIYWKRMYHLSCLNFSLKKYPEAMRLMERIGKLRDEQERWNLGRKIITILCEIEMEKFDKSDKSIEALRKYLQRNKVDGIADLPHKNIVKILVSLSKRSYLFKEIKSMNFPNLVSDNLLPEQDDLPEIRLFTEWLDSRMNDKVA